MSTINDMIEGIKRADALLSDDDLEPRAERKDWGRAKEKIAELRKALEEDVEAHHEAALEEADETEIAPLVRRRTARLHADTAAVLQASGDGIGAMGLLAKAEKIADDPEMKAELRAAQKEPDAFARVALARWLLHDGRFADAEREAERARREAKEPALRAIAKEILRGPRPLSGSPPPLFTLNGFGTRLYGERDVDSEGRFIATYCVCLLFIPVLPIAAYRVKRGEGRSYRFFAKERLSPLARAAQALVGLAVVGSIAGYGVSEYLASPDHRAEVALREARAIEKAGKDEEALEAYRRIAQQFSARTSAVTGAVAGVGRLAAKRIPAPCDAGSVEAVRRAANAFVTLPEDARSGGSATELVKRLDACATEIGDGAPDRRQAGLRVLDLAADVAKGSTDASWITERRATARRAFAIESAAARPMLALAELSRLEDAESVAAGKKVILGLGAGPSLWVEGARDIERWIGHARAGLDAEGPRTAGEKLAAARAASAASAKIIASNDAPAIEKAAGEHPDDQELAIALASRMRAAGDGKGARGVIEKLGPPGRTTAAAQQLLAGLLADAGELAKADEILTGLCDERLPAFQDAQRAWNSAAERVASKAVDELQVTVPPDLAKQVENVTDEEKKRNIVHAWISERVQNDPSVASARAEYLGSTAAVEASLSLGLVKLRRAAAATGDERRRLLGQAESAFLAIRDEAAGEASLHLGLGQVFFRLGKNEEGEKELRSVLDRKDPVLALEVARTYRELGLFSRARAVAREVFEAGSDPRAKNAAADLLAHLATNVDEEEEWLRRSDTSDPNVRVSLELVAGERLLRDGKLADADQKFKTCVEFYDQSAKTSAVAANNAATETLRRYEATGDAAHLRVAVTYLETAAKLDPDNALVLGNLSAALAHLGFVTVLEKWVDTKALSLDIGAAQDLAAALVDGPLGQEVLDALRKDPAFQRALEMGKRQQILAPQARDGYHLELQWAEWSRDVKALEELEKRVDVLSVSNDVDSDERRRWLAGESDEAKAHDAKARVAIARHRLERAKAGSKPTQAAAWMALSEALVTAAFFERDAASLDEMADAARKARAAWPEGATRGDVSAALFASAFYKALGASPALKKAWEEERRKKGPVEIAFAAINGPSGAEVTSALRKEPATLDAASVRRQAASERPVLHDFLYARLAGDVELAESAAKGFDRRDQELGFVIRAKLQPADDKAKLLLDLFRARGAAR